MQQVSLARYILITFLHYNRTILISSIVIAVVIMWSIGTNFNQKKVSAIPNLIVEYETCLTSSTTNHNTFIAFVINKHIATLLLDKLCKDKVINNQFGKIEVRWSNRDQDIIQYVGKGIAQLALVKENLMQAFAIEQTYGYKVIGTYQNYSAYFISLKEKPEISKQYLWGKTLGLLDYPSSRSGHIIPKKILKDLGLTEQSINITYATSHEELRSLLASGDVDIISSYWQQEDSERFSHNYITQIEEDVSGSKWYLKMDTDNTDLVCGAQRILLQLTQDMDSEYYNQIIVPEQCNANKVDSQ
ncbi:PhnD/SsuA/transferrin family substrate-binding protein [Paraglaciecola sp. 2405UD69-4]|uniref:PhnD/SsuA/transferrin family substrate-binding protein n=1 Tax=Paraglaciecola sp. 2405UD69-4 TaxID=3391836 RepID=UPI0039C9C679